MKMDFEEEEPDFEMTGEVKQDSEIDIYKK